MSKGNTRKSRSQRSNATPAELSSPPDLLSDMPPPDDNEDDTGGGNEEAAEMETEDRFDGKYQEGLKEAPQPRRGPKPKPGRRGKPRRAPVQADDVPDDSHPEDSAPPEDEAEEPARSPAVATPRSRRKSKSGKREASPEPKKTSTTGCIRENCDCEKYSAPQQPGIRYVACNLFFFSPHNLSMAHPTPSFDQSVVWRSSSL